MLFYRDEANGIEVHWGDCRDVLPDLCRSADYDGCDLLLTDPPYGQMFNGQGAKTAQANIRGDGARQGMRLVRQMLFAAEPLLTAEAHTLLFCHWESWPDFYDIASGYTNIKNALIWHKDRGGMG